MSVESHAEKETVGAAKPGKVQQSRLRSLDILRGIAILLVFVNHFEPRVIPYTANLTGGLATFVYWRVKSLGWTGVDMFFCAERFFNQRSPLSGNGQNERVEMLALLASSRIQNMAVVCVSIGGAGCWKRDGVH